MQLIFEAMDRLIRIGTLRGTIAAVCAFALIWLPGFLPQSEFIAFGATSTEIVGSGHTHDYVAVHGHSHDDVDEANDAGGHFQRHDAADHVHITLYFPGEGGQNFIRHTSARFAFIDNPPIYDLFAGIHRPPITV